MPTLRAAALVTLLPIAAQAAPVDLAALGLVLGDPILQVEVSVDYLADADILQASDADATAVLDGNPLASDAVLQAGGDDFVSLVATGPEALGSEPGLLELLAEIELAEGAFAGTGPLVLARIEAPGLDLSADAEALPGTLTAFEVAPIPLPAAAWLLAAALGALSLARRRGG
jgi:hypothetical protein